MEHLSFKKGDLQYNKKQVTTEQANKIGTELLKDSMFTDSRVTSAKLEKPDSIFMLTIVFNRAKVDNDIKDAMREMSMRYSEDTLNSAQLDIVLADTEWAPIDTVHYRTLGKQIMVDGSRVFYTTASGLEATTKLKDNLKLGGFFKDGTKIFRLDKNADGYLFELYSTPGVRSETEQAGLRESAKYWSKEVFGGTPVTFELCDITMKPFLVIKPKGERS
jgi:hypothetical protein